MTVGHHAMMYNIKDHLTKSIEEVQYLDDLGCFMDYNTYLETGFILKKSMFKYDDLERTREMTVLNTNFKKNLFKIKKEVFSYELSEFMNSEGEMEPDVKEVKDFEVYGTIGMSHSLMDIVALKDIHRILAQGDDL